MLGQKGADCAFTICGCTDCTWPPSTCCSVDKHNFLVDLRELCKSTELPNQCNL